MSRAPDPSPRPRVLVVRAGALGDLLLLRPALAGLHAAGHEAALLAPATPGRALLDAGGSGVAEAFDYDSTAFTPLHVGQAPTGAAGERLRRFDLALAYTGQAGVVDGLTAAGLRVIAQTPAPQSGQHAAHWLARPLEEMGAKAPDLPPSFQATEEERRGAAEWAGVQNLGASFLALHPGSGSAVKNWPAEAFGELARHLAPGERWLLVLGPADVEPAATLAQATGAVVARDLPLRVLGALLRGARLFVGNDSGVSHLAAAWGVSTLALFGPTDPGVWAPVGEDVGVVRSPTSSMSDLALAAVLDAARAQMRGGRTSSRLISR